MRNKRIELGFKYFFPRKRQALTQQQIIKRIEFCKKQLECNIEKWTKQVIITEESRFGIYPDNSMIWIRRGCYNEQSFVSTNKFTKTFMVWGGIGYNYKSKLIFVDDQLSTDKYIQMLESNEVLQQIHLKFENNEVFFQQDGAPAHKASKSIQYIKSKINLIEDWPPNSPY